MVLGKSRKRACSESLMRESDTPDANTSEVMPVIENCDVFSPSSSTRDLRRTESSALNRLSRAELLTLFQIPDHELKRKLIEAIQDRDPTWELLTELLGRCVLWQELARVSLARIQLSSVRTDDTRGLCSLNRNLILYSKPLARTSPRFSIMTWIRLHPKNS